MPRTDFNGDGLDDILLRQRGGGPVGAWLTDEDGTFHLSASSQIGVPAEWLIVATGDFNGDGNDDIVWYNGSHIGNWLGQDNGGWVVNDKLLALNGFSVTFAADFNSDGVDELLIVGGAPPGGNYVIDVVSAYGDGDFDYSMGAYASVPGDWHIVGVGDFDGDGQDDILWRNDEGAIGNWLTRDSYNNAIGAIGGVMDDWVINSASIRQVSNDWRIVGIGDLNGDGFDDILWRHIDGAIGTWSGGDLGLFTINQSSIVAVPTDWYVAGVGNYDGDGIDDILWHNVNGATGTWSGTESGGFVINPEISQIADHWLVQPNPSGAGEWDY